MAKETEASRRMLVGAFAANHGRNDETDRSMELVGSQEEEAEEAVC